ncbi:MAG TPA: nuclear transport factor 2 family protein [Acidimicrobiales bacterium]|jgi:3-phenylpropionate/cinnamic acid dioxygenase small subunit|nr:nuclear transport factor 2 family protein [Acidimicrobiales bacterium]
MDLQALQDRVEITDLLHRYARALDTKDWDLLASVFTPDAHLDYTSSGCPAGPRDEVVPWLARALEPVPMTQHLITNVEIDLDGDRATVRALFHNPLQLPGMPGVSHCGGTYEHEVVRTPEGWRSRRLVETMLWSSNPVPPTMPSPVDGDAGSG